MFHQFEKRAPPYSQNDDVKMMITFSFLNIVNLVSHPQITTHSHLNDSKQKDKHDKTEHYH